jgi:hypothetical protein
LLKPAKTKYKFADFLGIANIRISYMFPEALTQYMFYEICEEIVGIVLEFKCMK